MKKRIYNFSAGPAVLPDQVLEIIADNLYSYRQLGVGIMELSHRSVHFKEIIEDAETNLRELLNVSNDYAVLFTTGGGTNQFSMVPMNLCPSDTIANYVVTDYWANNAYNEANRLSRAHIAASSEDRNFSYIPRNFELSEHAAYLHFTSNNTAYGTQFQVEPNVDKSIPLVCDGSSDLLCKPLDITKYGLLYSVAQKNLGPAGVTVVIIRKDLLERSPQNLPLMMNYNTYAAHQSIYNTPPTFPIYVVGEVFKWKKRLGGLKEIEKKNQRKASLLYEAIDRSGFYVGIAEKNCRSLMNIVFHLQDLSLEPVFLQEAEEQGFSSLKGHPSAGGIRASIYNAFPEEGVIALVSFMKHFEEKYG